MSHTAIQQYSRRRVNVAQIGTCEQSMIDNVQSPNPEELRDQEEEIR